MKKFISIVLALLLCAVSAFGALAETTSTEGGYVLMNIPYDQFYAAEVTDASNLDAVASATLMKPRTIGLAGGSYHVNPDGSDITGVIFPVYVEDLSVLPTLGGVEITDESSVDITVTNKGQESTTTFTGSDALFEAPSFSWYALNETPAVYKTLNSDGSFSTIVGETVTLDGAADIIYDRHADVVIRVTGADEALADKNVSSAVLILDDGTKVGLRHIANLWRKTEIGFALDSDVCAAVKGKKITSIEYITLDGMYDLSVTLAIPEDETLLKLTGTYIELFPEFAKEDYKDYWMECIEAYIDDDATAEMYYTMLTATYMGTLKGQEAIDAYSADPASMLFDCFFENGVAKFVISGDVISGVDAEGNELFRHTYHFAEDLPVSFLGQPTGTSLHVYQADDADAGVFTYFAFADDTLKETYHIEFRYGEYLADLGSYSEGEYAYWLAAGINDGYKDNQIKACIKLFVDENVGGQEEQEASSVIEIATAEDLAAINKNLSGNYVLTADIDLAGIEWTPIGAFQPLSDAPEDAEIPHPDYAFTGRFDGNGHTISNLTITSGPMMGTGLFGCASGTERGEAYIGNFTLENVNVTGCYLVGGAVGLQFMNCKVSDIKLAGENKLAGMQGIGGIVGTGFDLISNCSATADITAMGDDGACAGLIAGGTTMSSIENCQAVGGSITAEGNATWAFGAICGAPWGAPEIRNCTATDTVIRVTGSGNRLVGGLLGFAGTYDPESPTQIVGCKVENVTLEVSDSTDSVGGLVGAGKEMMEGSDVMSSFAISDCTVSGMITGGGEYVDAVVGDPACAVTIACEGGMTIE